MRCKGKAEPFSCHCPPLRSMSYAGNGAQLSHSHKLGAGLWEGVATRQWDGTDGRGQDRVGVVSERGYVVESLILRRKRQKILKVYFRSVC